MTNIDLPKFCELGGDRRRPPYVDVVGGGQPDAWGIVATPRVRIYISATWYPTWSQWREAAQIAVDTVIRGVNPLLIARGVTVGAVTELEPNPPFIYDRNRLVGTDILLNAAAVQNENDYDAVLLLAEAKKRVFEAGKLKKGITAEFTSYSPAMNGDRTAFDDAADLGKVDDAHIRSLMQRCVDGDEWAQLRELRIAEYARLFEG